MPETLARHDSSRTFGTLTLVALIESQLLHTEGLPMKIQQQILGHNKATTTLLYAEPGEDKQRQALGKILSLLFPNVAKLQPELQLEAPR